MARTALTCRTTAPPDRTSTPILRLSPSPRPAPTLRPTKAAISIGTMARTALTCRTTAPPDRTSTPILRLSPSPRPAPTLRPTKAAISIGTMAHTIHVTTSTPTASVARKRQTPVTAADHQAASRKYLRRCANGKVTCGSVIGTPTTIITRTALTCRTTAPTAPTGTTMVPTIAAKVARAHPTTSSYGLISLGMDEPAPKPRTIVWATPTSKKKPHASITSTRPAASAPTGMTMVRTAPTTTALIGTTTTFANLCAVTTPPNAAITSGLRGLAITANTSTATTITANNGRRASTNTETPAVPIPPLHLLSASSKQGIAYAIPTPHWIKASWNTDFF